MSKETILMRCSTEDFGKATSALRRNRYGVEVLVCDPWYKGGPQTARVRPSRDTYRVKSKEESDRWPEVE